MSSKATYLPYLGCSCGRNGKHLFTILSGILTIFFPVKTKALSFYWNTKFVFQQGTSCLRVCPHHIVELLLCNSFFVCFDMYFICTCWPWTPCAAEDDLELTSCRRMRGSDWRAVTTHVLLYPIYAVSETKPEALNITDKHDTNVATFPAYLCISFTSLASLPLPECWDSHLASYFFNKENEGPCISFAYTKGYWNMKK